MRSKHEHYVYSAYCQDIQNYPYMPFFAKNNAEAIQKFARFLRNSEYVAPNLELHLIGTCEIYENGGMPQNLQPLIIPMRVEIKNNFFARTVVLGTYYKDLLMDYIKTFKENYLCKHYNKKTIKKH